LRAANSESTTFSLDQDESGASDHEEDKPEGDEDRPESAEGGPNAADPAQAGLAQMGLGDEEELAYPESCFPPAWYEKMPALKGKEDSPFWIGWANLRLKTFRLIENKYFETAVIIMILLSSLALVGSFLLLQMFLCF